MPVLLLRRKSLDLWGREGEVTLWRVAGVTGQEWVLSVKRYN